jgi:membrane fusion protein, heavy metal efflux system
VTFKTEAAPRSGGHRTRSSLQPTGRPIGRPTGRFKLFALLALHAGLVGCGATHLDGDDERDAAGEAAADGRVSLTQAQLERAGVVLVPAGGESGGDGLVLQGTVLSPDTARVMAGSWVEGRVERLHVLEGDEVREGDALVRIHSHELADWEREFTAAEAELRLVERAVERGRELLAAGAIPRAELERRELDETRARADFDRATAILRHLNPDGDDVMVLAQRAGTVLRIFVSPGEAVLPGTPLVEIGSTRRLWVSGALPETLAGQVRVGDPVTLTFPALPGMEAEGTVLSMGAQVDPLLRTLDLRVQAEAMPDGVRLGMQATMRVGRDAAPSSPEAGVRVPVAALQRDGAGFVIFVSEGDGDFRAVPVQVLERGITTALVVGIAAGTPVVTEGAYTLRAVLEGFLGPEDHE